MKSLGNRRVAYPLPTERLNLAWRLATGPLKGGGCQARRRPPTWQRAGCQAGAKRKYFYRRSSNSTGTALATNAPITAPPTPHATSVRRWRDATCSSKEATGRNGSKYEHARRIVVTRIHSDASALETTSSTRFTTCARQWNTRIAGARFASSTSNSGSIGVKVSGGLGCRSGSVAGRSEFHLNSTPSEQITPVPASRNAQSRHRTLRGNIARHRNTHGQYFSRHHDDRLMVVCPPRRGAPQIGRLRHDG